MSLLFDVQELPVQQNEALVSRRYGKLILSNSLLTNSPESVQKMFGKIIPVSMEYDYATECFSITALSQEFEPVEQGSMIPYYHVAIRLHRRKKGTGKAYYFIFTKVDIG